MYKKSTDSCYLTDHTRSIYLSIMSEFVYVNIGLQIMEH